MHLVRDAADQIEQRGERHRRRHLVADVVRVVQVLAAGERFAGKFGRRGRRSSRSLPGSPRATSPAFQQPPRFARRACPARSN